MGKLEELKQLQKEIVLINRSAALLQWDLETYLPEEGSEGRAEQISTLSAMVHDRLVSDELYNLLRGLESEKLGDIDAIMVKRLLHDVERERKLPREFVEELSRVSSRAFSSWKKAKENNDFGIFEKDLENIVELKKKEAEYVGYKEHPYDALIDEYEEGMTTKKVFDIFEKLKPQLINLIKKIEASPNYNDKDEPLFAEGSFPKEKQFELVKDVSKRIGLDDSVSRVDLAPHPFTISLGSKDVRITTRIVGDSLYSFTSTVHEAGHALYELNLPEKFEFTVLHDAPSLGIHESQSRFWENMIGRGKSFWKFYFEKFKGLTGTNKSFEEFYKAVNKVYPGFIRTEADEVHYCLHIILRFELEKGLLEGSIKVKDLPRIWNEKFKEYFGVDVPKDSEGVLQDIHWSHASFGYFPTYAIGTIYAAQIYEAMKKNVHDAEEQIEKGEFEKIAKWLKENIHKYGRLLLADEIVQKACGEGFNSDNYISYLTQKYSEIYQLS